jgi:hypothetical protein
MSDLPALPIHEIARAVGVEDNPMFHTAYRMLAAGQHPLSVREKIRNLGGDMSLEALVNMRAMIPGATKRSDSVFPEEVITDPLADFHRAFALQKERVQMLIEEEQRTLVEKGEGYSPAVDVAIKDLQDSAERLALLMQKLGYNPYAQQGGQREEKGVPLFAIINMTKEELRGVIAGDAIDGEVTEL